MSRGETVVSHELNGFSCMGKPLDVFNIVDSSEHGLFRRVSVQVKLCLMWCLESIHANLDGIRTDVEIIGDISDKPEHFLEVRGTNRAGRIQQEDNVGLSIARWKYKIQEVIIKQQLGR